MAKNEKQDSTKKAYQGLLDTLKRLQDERAAVLEFCQHPAIAPILKKFTNEAESRKEALVYCEKKDVDGLQASDAQKAAREFKEKYVKAVLSLTATLAAAYETELNELLLSGKAPKEEVDATTGEVKTGAA